MWLPGWENVVYEDVSGEVQEVGELSSGRSPQTEDRIDSTVVSNAEARLHYYIPIKCWLLCPNLV